MAITLTEVFADLMELLDMEDPEAPPAHLRERVVREINATLQVIQSAGYDYFTREPVTVSLTTGESTYALDNDIQGVIRPVRLANGTPLSELQTRGEYDLFGPTFLGTASVSNGTPMAYYLQRTRQTGADNVKVELLVIPKPSADQTATLEVVKEAPRFTLADVDAEEEKAFPIPHQYVESILLPIARLMLTTCNYFHRAELLDRLREEDAKARALLDLVDPQTPAADDLSERKKAAARAAAREAYRSTT